MINIIFAVDQNNNFCTSDNLSLPWSNVKEDMIWFIILNKNINLKII